MRDIRTSIVRPNGEISVAYFGGFRINELPELSNDSGKKFSDKRNSEKGIQARPRARPPTTVSNISRGTNRDAKESIYF